ncbi:hypothetical protein D3C87_628260 [compost metagenome]
MYSGDVGCKKDSLPLPEILKLERPRTCTEPLKPGAPVLFWMFKPGTLPCKSCSTFDTGIS